jgi:hypothetical protein
VQCAARIAAFDSSDLQGAEQGPADAAKSCIRGDVVEVISAPSVTEPTARMVSPPTATSTELSERAIHEATICGVLLASHRPRISESLR